MNYSNLTDDQIIHLAKLRLANEKPMDFTIQSLTITFKELVKDYLIVTITIKTKEWADASVSISFQKLFPNEFLYLQSIGFQF
jgi:hypothetical protein